MAEVFVFGSNRQGRHGKGAALEAVRRHGAVYGRAYGRHGNSYAIVTKELRWHWPPVHISEIREGVEEFKRHAAEHPEDTFIVTPIGCGLAGFEIGEIAPLFAGCSENVQLPEVFKEVLEYHA